MTSEMIAITAFLINVVTIVVGVAVSITRNKQNVATVAKELHDGFIRVETAIQDLQTKAERNLERVSSLEVQAREHERRTNRLESKVFNGHG